MISKKYIRELLGYINEPKQDATIEDLFNYILESEIVGAYSNIKDLINKLSNDQFKLFINWFNGQDTTRDLSFFINYRGAL